MRGFIDVHAHPVTPDYVEAMRNAGVSDVDGFPLPEWSEEGHLELLDRHGISAAVLSFSAPGISFASGRQARELARRLDEAAAERRARTNGRLGAFAVLTLPDVDGALEEMAYALDELGLDGISLLTNVRGDYLGDPAFDAIFAEADRRGTVISTYPVAPIGYEHVAVGYAAPALEYPFETTRMLVNLVASGTLRRHPSLKLIASHGGGTIPFLAERIAGISPYFNRLDPSGHADRDHRPAPAHPLRLHRGRQPRLARELQRLRARGQARCTAATRRSCRRRPFRRRSQPSPRSSTRASSPRFAGATPRRCSRASDQLDTQEPRM